MHTQQAKGTHLWYMSHATSPLALSLMFPEAHAGVSDGRFSTGGMYGVGWPRFRAAATGDCACQHLKNWAAKPYHSACMPGAFCQRSQTSSSRCFRPGEEARALAWRICTIHHTSWQ